MADVWAQRLRGVDTSYATARAVAEQVGVVPPASRFAAQPPVLTTVPRGGVQDALRRVCGVPVRASSPGRSTRALPSEQPQPQARWVRAMVPAEPSATTAAVPLQCSVFGVHDAPPPANAMGVGVPGGYDQAAFTNRLQDAVRRMSGVGLDGSFDDDARGGSGLAEQSMYSLSPSPARSHLSQSQSLVETSTSVKATHDDPAHPHVPSASTPALQRMISLSASESALSLMSTVPRSVHELPPHAPVEAAAPAAAAHEGRAVPTQRVVDTTPVGSESAASRSSTAGPQQQLRAPPPNNDDYFFRRSACGSASSVGDAADASSSVIPAGRQDTERQELHHMMARITSSLDVSVASVDVAEAPACSDRPGVLLGQRDARWGSDGAAHATQAQLQPQQMPQNIRISNQAQGGTRGEDGHEQQPQPQQLHDSGNSPTGHRGGGGSGHLDLPGVPSYDSPPGSTSANDSYPTRVTCSVHSGGGGAVDRQTSGLGKGVGGEDAHAEPSASARLTSPPAPPSAGVPASSNDDPEEGIASGGGGGGSGENLNADITCVRPLSLGKLIELPGDESPRSSDATSYGPLQPKVSAWTPRVQTQAQPPADPPANPEDEEFSKWMAEVLGRPLATDTPADVTPAHPGLGRHLSGSIPSRRVESVTIHPTQLHARGAGAPASTAVALDASAPLPGFGPMFQSDGSLKDGRQLQPVLKSHKQSNSSRDALDTPGATSPRGAKERPPISPQARVASNSAGRAAELTLRLDSPRSDASAASTASAPRRRHKRRLSSHAGSTPTFEELPANNGHEEPEQEHDPEPPAPNGVRDRPSTGHAHAPSPKVTPVVTPSSVVLPIPAAVPVISPMQEALAPSRTATVPDNSDLFLTDDSVQSWQFVHTLESVGSGALDEPRQLRSAPTFAQTPTPTATMPTTVTPVRSPPRGSVVGVHSPSTAQRRSILAGGGREARVFGQFLKQRTADAPVAPGGGHAHGQQGPRHSLQSHAPDRRETWVSLEQFSPRGNSSGCLVSGGGGSGTSALLEQVLCSMGIPRKGSTGQWTDDMSEEPQELNASHPPARGGGDDADAETDNEATSATAAASPKSYGSADPNHPERDLWPGLAARAVDDSFMRSETMSPKVKASPRPRTPTSPRPRCGSPDTEGPQFLSPVPREFPPPGSPKKVRGGSFVGTPLSPRGPSTQQLRAMSGSSFCSSNLGGGPGAGSGSFGINSQAALEAARAPFLEKPLSRSSRSRSYTTTSTGAAGLLSPKQKPQPHGHQGHAKDRKPGNGSLRGSSPVRTGAMTERRHSMIQGNSRPRASVAVGKEEKQQKRRGRSHTMANEAAGAVPLLPIRSISRSGSGLGGSARTTPRGVDKELSAASQPPPLPDLAIDADGHAACNNCEGRSPAPDFMGCEQCSAWLCKACDFAIHNMKVFADHARRGAPMHIHAAPAKPPSSIGTPLGAAVAGLDSVSILSPQQLVDDGKAKASADPLHAAVASPSLSDVYAHLQPKVQVQSASGTELLPTSAVSSMHLNAKGADGGGAVPLTSKPLEEIHENATLSVALDAMLSSVASLALGHAHSASPARDGRSPQHVRVGTPGSGGHARASSTRRTSSPSVPRRRSLSPPHRVGVRGGATGSPQMGATATPAAPPATPLSLPGFLAMANPVSGGAMDPPAAALSAVRSRSKAMSPTVVPSLSSLSHHCAEIERQVGEVNTALQSRNSPMRQVMLAQQGLSPIMPPRLKSPGPARERKNAPVTRLRLLRREMEHGMVAPPTARPGDLTLAREVVSLPSDASASFVLKQTTAQGMPVEESPLTGAAAAATTSSPKEKKAKKKLTLPSAMKKIVGVGEGGAGSPSASTSLSPRSPRKPAEGSTPTAPDSASSKGQGRPPPTSPLRKGSAGRSGSPHPQLPQGNSGATASHGVSGSPLSAHSTMSFSVMSQLDATVPPVGAKQSTRGSIAAQLGASLTQSMSRISAVLNPPTDAPATADDDSHRSSTAVASPRTAATDNSGPPTDTIDAEVDRVIQDSRRSSAASARHLPRRVSAPSALGTDFFSGYRRASADTAVLSPGAGSEGDRQSGVGFGSAHHSRYYSPAADGDSAGAPGGASGALDANRLHSDGMQSSRDGSPATALYVSPSGNTLVTGGDDSQLMETRPRSRSANICDSPMTHGTDASAYDPYAQCEEDLVYNDDSENEEMMNTMHW